MLYREKNELGQVKHRVHRMQRDEELENDHTDPIEGQTLLEKIRQEDKNAQLTQDEKERL